MLQTYLEVIPSGVLQGLILALIVLGITISFKFLDFPDLTAEGSYPLGGAVCAVLMINGYNISLAILLAIIASGALGICTALLHIKYKIDTLLAGIIISTMNYSVILRIMGKPNLNLFGSNNLLNSIEGGVYSQIAIIAAINLSIIFILHLFLKTEKGLRFRAVGLNKECAEKQTVNLNKHIIAGLFTGNALCGLAGALIVQVQNYADINIGFGIVIHAIAAMMIGEKIIGNNSFAKIVILPIIGALIYQQIQGFAISAGLNPSDIKFLTGVIIITIIAIARPDILKKN